VRAHPRAPHHYLIGRVLWLEGRAALLALTSLGTRDAVGRRVLRLSRFGRVARVPHVVAYAIE